MLASLRKWLRLSPNEGGEELYEKVRILYDRRIIPSREGIQNALRPEQRRPEVCEAQS